VKVLRDPAYAEWLDAEREILEAFVRSQSSALIPTPIGASKVHGGEFDGQPALLLRFVDGFHFTLPAIRDASPNGVDPRHAVWILRRLLSLLAAMHANGVVHGAV